LSDRGAAHGPPLWLFSTHPSARSRVWFLAHPLLATLTRSTRCVEWGVMRGLGVDLCRDDGMTLVELLVVILIVGVLAAIAIPSFLDQQGKGFDTTAKESARAASLAAETYATEHGGSYTGISPEGVRQYDHSLQIAEGNNNAWVKTAEGAESGQGYVVTAVAPTSKDTFTVTRSAGGEIKRTCTRSAGSGGCRVKVPAGPIPVGERAGCAAQGAERPRR